MAGWEEAGRALVIMRFVLPQETPAAAEALLLEVLTFCIVADTQRPARGARAEMPTQLRRGEAAVRAVRRL